MKILLVGISVRAMAESAVRSGYSIIALDAFGDQDLKALAESYSLHHDFNSAYSTKALFKASRSLAFDAVAYTSNLENHPKILRQFGAKHRIIGNSHEVVIAIRHWPTLFAKLKQAGLAVPETIFSPSPEIDRPEAAASIIEFHKISPEETSHTVTLSSSGEVCTAWVTIVDPSALTLIL